MRTGSSGTDDHDTLTFQADLTKFVVAEPIPTQDAEIVAREFVHNIVLKFVITKVVLTDQGSNILSQLFQYTGKLLRIKKIHINAFHQNLTVGSRGVRGPLANISDVTEDQRDRMTGYPTPHVHNVTTQRATVYSPVGLLFGHRMRVPFSLKEQSPPRYNHDDYVDDLKGRLQAANGIARNRLLESKTRRKLLRQENRADSAKGGR